MLENQCVGLLDTLKGLRQNLVWLSHQVLDETRGPQTLSSVNEVFITDISLYLIILIKKTNLILQKS